MSRPPPAVTLLPLLLLFLLLSSYLPASHGFGLSTFSTSRRPSTHALSQCRQPSSSSSSGFVIPHNKMCLDTKVEQHGGTTMPAPSSFPLSPLDAAVASPWFVAVAAFSCLCLLDTAFLDSFFPLPAHAVTTTATATAAAAGIHVDVAGILQKAGRKAIGGGVSGAAASLVQLITLGGLRTQMNYQYRYGLSFKEAFDTLYKEGGIRRFYQGLSVAAVQLPLARFGDVAANAFMIAALDSFESTRGLPLPLKSGLGSIAAGAWRFLLMPLDAVKTTMQVQGAKGLPQVATRLKEEGVSSLYQGAVAQAVATAVGHWPYFLTFNYLSSTIPLPPPDAVLPRLGRNAFLGLCSSVVSDCCSNSIRVLKTTKQTSEKEISYREALQQVLDKDGVKGLFGRGLQTRLAANALQGMLFAVVWRYLEESNILFGGNK